MFEPDYRNIEDCARSPGYIDGREKAAIPSPIT